MSLPPHTAFWTLPEERTRPVANLRLPLASAAPSHTERLFPTLTSAQMARIAARGCFSSRHGSPYPETSSPSRAS